MIIDKAMSLLVGRFMGCGEMNKTNKDINEIKLERIRTKINPDHVRHVYIYIYIHSYIHAQTLFVFYSTDASANMSTDPTAIKCIALPAHARRSDSDTAAA